MAAAVFCAKRGNQLGRSQKNLPAAAGPQADRYRAREPESYVRLRAMADPKLIKLAGPGLASVGATANVTHASLPYDVPQAWFKALSAHPVEALGIAFPARHDDEARRSGLFEPSDGTRTEKDHRT